MDAERLLTDELAAGRDLGGGLVVIEHQLRVDIRVLGELVMPKGAEAVARVGTLVVIGRPVVVQVVAGQRPEFVRVVDRKVAECVRASSVKRRESAGVRRRGAAAAKRVEYENRIVVDTD